MESSDAVVETAAVPAVVPAPFAAVPSPLREALQKRGFRSLTAVQAKVLEDDVADRDLQITSQTGSGKTVALGFALAPRLLALKAPPAAPLVLIIAPTRELAMQVKEELQWLFAGARHVRLDCVTGGTSIQNERRRLHRPPAILVGTPGRLLDHVTNGAVQLDQVDRLVLDEADQMLDMGFRDELEALLQRLPAERRTHLVSATFAAAVRDITERYQRDPLHIEGTALGTANVDIAHVAHVLHARDRYHALVNILLLAGEQRTLVFVRTREDSTTLADQLAADGFTAQPLSGDLTQAQRTRTLGAFRNGNVRTLVATDVAARGLDIPEVATVVQMDLPIDHETYTHRSGRTGRAGQKGTSIVLCPKAAQQRLRRMLEGARIDVRWAPVPGAAQVRAVQQERMLTRQREALAARNWHAAYAALAAQLLHEQQPQDVVAALLADLSRQTARQPFDVESEVPAASTSRRERSMSGPRRDTRDTRGPRDLRFVRFAINWGSRRGADAGRILAHICRRGDIDRQLVGAIDLDADRATFEIAEPVANAFARRCVVPDRRDPELIITRVGGGAPGVRDERDERDERSERAPRRPDEHKPGPRRKTFGKAGRGQMPPHLRGRARSYAAAARTKAEKH